MMKIVNNSFIPTYKTLLFHLARKSVASSINNITFTNLQIENNVLKTSDSVKFISIIFRIPIQMNNLSKFPTVVLWKCKMSNSTIIQIYL
jgi:hypothetical protein